MLFIIKMIIDIINIMTTDKKMIKKIDYIHIIIRIIFSC